MKLHIIIETNENDVLIVRSFNMKDKEVPNIYLSEIVKASILEEKTREEERKKNENTY